MSAVRNANFNDRFKAAQQGRSNGAIDHKRLFGWCYFKAVIRQNDFSKADFSCEKSGHARVTVPAQLLLPDANFRSLEAQRAACQGTSVNIRFDRRFHSSAANPKTEPFFPMLTLPMRIQFHRFSITQFGSNRTRGCTPFFFVAVGTATKVTFQY